MNFECAFCFHGALLLLFLSSGVLEALPVRSLGLIDREWGLEWKEGGGEWTISRCRLGIKRGFVSVFTAWYACVLHTITTPFVSTGVTSQYISPPTFALSLQPNHPHNQQAHHPPPFPGQQNNQPHDPPTKRTPLPYNPS